MPIFYSPSSPVQHFLVPRLQQDGLITEQIEAADYLLLPFGYEFVDEYNLQQLEAMGISVEEAAQLKLLAVELDNLSVITGKPLVVIHYRDPSHTFPLQHALVFRTSGIAGRKGVKEFGLPAFIEHFSGNTEWKPRPKIEKPGVSFRGQSAPLVLPLSSQIRFAINAFSEKLGSGKWVPEYYSPGYVLRRRAAVALKKQADKLLLDLHLNPAGKKDDYRNDYLKSFQEYDYFLAIAGHGNYSFRLYEIMREGRIPVLVNSRCLMPCADVIDWQKLTIWVEEADIQSIPERILDIHASLHADDYAQWQQQMRATYYAYLTTEGFYQYFLSFLALRAGTGR